MKQVLCLRSPSPQLLGLPHNPHDLSTPHSLVFSSLLSLFRTALAMSSLFFFLAALDSSRCSGYVPSLAYNKNLSPNRIVILAVSPNRRVI